MSRVAAVSPAISDLLTDPDVTEIMVNAPDQIFVERAGTIELTDVRFSDETALRYFVERALTPLGLRVDQASPVVDARMDDGSRLHAVIPPVAVHGPVVTIRRPARQAWTLESLLRAGAFTKTDLKRLSRAVTDRRNILVTGGSGTGKTSLLAALVAQTNPGSRVVILEDTAELVVEHPHLIRLEGRPPNPEGAGAVTMRDLVKCSLRMRPDRIVVGEVRSVEAADMIAALNTGHEGSMATIHANSALDALTRLETLLLTAVPGLSVEAAQRQISTAIHLVVSLARRADGSRRVTELLELT